MIDRLLLGLPVLYETPHEIVLVKPSGMASELTSDPKGASLLSRLRRACLPPLDPKLPHRLDRITRGVMLVALTAESIAFHGEQIRSGVWEKYYLARARVPIDRDITSLLGQHKAYLKQVRHRAQIVRSGGKPSFLEILSAHPAPGRSDHLHVLVKLLTGRFHQVRIMLTGLGIPLVGDPLYGTETERRDHRQVEHGFYLEHIVLRYVEYDTQVARVAHWRDDPDREAIAAPVRAAIDALIDRSQRQP